MSDKGLIKKIKNEIVLVNMKKVNVNRRMIHDKGHHVSMPHESFPGFEEMD